MKKSLTIIAIVLFLVFGLYMRGLLKQERETEVQQAVNEYNSILKEIELLSDEIDKYESHKGAELAEYNETEKKYIDLNNEYEAYKAEYPKDIIYETQEIQSKNKNYASTVLLLNNKISSLKNEVARKQQTIVSSNNSGSNNTSSNGGSSNNSSNKHIGRSVYISKGNRYYHAISNCKYLEGASTSKVTLTESMGKFECNCWTNPIPYKPSTSSSNSGSSSGSSSSGRTVYIASGNSYYHKSPSCKFLQGAGTTAVSINNVGGKHACNCIKY